MKFRYHPRAKHVAGTMNKLEERYVREVLEPMRMVGNVVEWHFESIKLKLAANTFYTPDFLVITKDQIEFHEVKGFWEDDARVKIKCAAEKFWQFQFIAVKFVKKQWEIETFN